MGNLREVLAAQQRRKLASNLKAASKDNPSDHQRHISKLLRKATRLRPRLDTYDLEDFKKL